MLNYAVLEYLKIIHEYDKACVFALAGDNIA